MQALRERFGGANEAEIHDPHFRAIAANVINDSGTRMAPYAGMPTLLDAPAGRWTGAGPNSATWRSRCWACRWTWAPATAAAVAGPRALRAIERVGPYNHVLKCTPVTQLRVADIGDVPMRSRFSLDQSHEDIEAIYRHIQQAGVIPLSAGGDHSVTLPILRALGRERPLALIHFDAHCDTGGRSTAAASITAARSARPCSTACSIPRAPSRSASAARPSICGSFPTPRA